MASSGARTGISVGTCDACELTTMYNFRIVPDDAEVTHEIKCPICSTVINTYKVKGTLHNMRVSSFTHRSRYCESCGIVTELDPVIRKDIPADETFKIVRQALCSTCNQPTTQIKGYADAVDKIKAGFFRHLEERNG